MKFVNELKEEVIDDNTAHKVLDVKDAQDVDSSKVFCCIYKCGTKTLSKAVTKAFKLIFK